MKSKLTIFIATLFLCVWTSSVTAQTTVPNGKAQLIEFTNVTSNFTVPEGKTWVIYSIFSEYVVDGLDIRIFLKDLNGIEKTNYLKNIYGTQLYRSSDLSTVIPYPIIFPEKTAFSLIILKGDLESLQLYNGKAYISLIEINN